MSGWHSLEPSVCRDDFRFSVAPREAVIPNEEYQSSLSALLLLSELICPALLHRQASRQHYIVGMRTVVGPEAQRVEDYCRCWT